MLRKMEARLAPVPGHPRERARPARVLMPTHAGRTAGSTARHAGAILNPNAWNRGLQSCSTLGRVANAGCKGMKANARWAAEANFRNQHGHASAGGAHRLPGSADSTVPFTDFRMKAWCFFTSSHTS